MDGGTAIICLVWLLTGCSGSIVIARSAMKMLRYHGLAWEDYLMIVSMTLAVVYGISTTLLYNVDFGTHPQQLAAFYSPKFAEYLYISHAIGFMAPLFSRISFCLYMLRVVSTTSISRKRTVHAFIALQVAVNVPITVFVFTQCGSFRTLWEHGILAKAPSCVRHDIIKVLALVAVAFNAMTDVFLTILPAVVVWSIKVMTKRARAGLVATLGLSFFATIASVLKIYYVYALYTHVPSKHILDHLIMVMGVEINIVVIAASIPVLAPLAMHNRSKSSMYKDPVLPTYDTSIESTSKSHSLQLSKTFGRHSIGKLPSVATCDLGSDSKENAKRGAHGRQTQILKITDVTVDMVELERDVALKDEIVPRSLRESVSTAGSSDVPSLESWDELPTPPFLSDKELSSGAVQEQESWDALPTPPFLSDKELSSGAVQERESWDELPTPPFLSDKELSLGGVQEQ